MKRVLTKIELFERSSARDIELVASKLIFYEVGNTILKHFRDTDIDGSEYMNQLFFLNIEYGPLDQPLAREVIKIAQTHDITYYDAVHMTLSQQNKSFLVTEDKELLRKFENAISMRDALEKIEKELKPAPHDSDKNLQ